MRFGSSKEKGVAGLTIFLSLITMLFVIGLLVMIFALMGGELMDAAAEDIENNATAVSVINKTTDALAEAVDWFDLFIVIGAMVVLILLTVIIITAIRGSGLIAAGGTA